jgi:hypothetical protein
MSNIRRVGVLFIVLGILFGLETYFSIKILSNLWPLLATSLGAGLVTIFYKRQKRENIYLIIGIYIICFSITALYLNFTSWEILGNLWPLFLAFAGISFLIPYLLNNTHKLFLFTSIFFFSVALIFFLVFSISKSFWWLIFILLGISIFLI